VLSQWVTFALQGLLKLIERRKTEERVTEFVRQSIRRFHSTQQQGTATAGGLSTAQ
jgi:hypothetical protein